MEVLLQGLAAREPDRIQDDVREGQERDQRAPEELPAVRDEEAEGRDDEVQEPRRLVKLQEDMTRHYIAREQKAHAMAVCVKGNLLTLPRDIYGAMSTGPFQDEGTIIRCLKCGLRTETRRWKQVRERARRKVKEERARRDPRGGAREGWEVLEQAHALMEQILRDGVKKSRLDIGGLWAGSAIVQGLALKVLEPGK